MEHAKTPNGLERVVGWMEKICEVVCMILVSVVFLSTITQVFCRFIMSSPLVWSEELSRYAGVWLVMLSTGIAIRQRKHMAIDILITRFKPHNQLWFTLFGDIVVLLVCVYMTIASYQLAAKFAANTSIALKLSMGVVYGGTVVGWFCSIFSSVCNVLSTVHALKGGNDV